MKNGNLELKNGVMIISGRICFQNVVSILHQGIKIIGHLEKIKVELKKLTHSDSSIFTLFTTWIRIAQKEKKAIIFTHAPLFIRDVSRVYGLDSVLPISWEN